jgi:DNA polymerase III subunit chi
MTNPGTLRQTQGERIEKNIPHLMPTITFHVLTDTARDAHLRHACRLVEHAVEQGQRVFVRVGNDADLKRMDELLWTFGEHSFLPHEIARAGAPPSHERVRVLLGHDAPPTFAEVLVNLDSDALIGATAPAIIELVPTGDELKRAARARFKAYRDAGLNPATQNV